MTTDFTRRSAIQTLSAGAAFIAGAGCSASAEQALTTAQRFAKSAKRNPWTLGFSNAPANDLHTARMKLINGKVPVGLKGTFYRNGPALFERDDLRLNHWFDGDGMVQAYKIEDGNVSHTGRMVRTGKFDREEKEGRFLAAAFGTKIENPMPLTGPDDANAANTSVLPIGGELLALWEGGSAYRLDDETLETIGSKTWAPELTGMPFSAHPRIETNGTVWNFGQDVFNKRLVIYKISADGALAGVHLLKNVPAGMIHDFCMTERHLIFVAPSFRAVQSADTFLGHFKWLPNEAQRVIVVEKDNLDNRREYDLPAGMQFHYGNAWEDKSGDIRFAVCTGNASFVQEGVEALMQGKYLEFESARLAHVVLRKSGRAEIAYSTKEKTTHEFPQFNNTKIGKRAEYLYTVGLPHKTGPGEHGVVKHNVETGDVTTYDYGKDTISEEHLFIPRSGATSEDDGWLIATSLNLKTKATRLNILNASRIADGPAAVLELPYALPLGFHGAWKGA